MYSVIVPIINEEENLKELLPRLFNPNCEVIICDNGSTDGSQRIITDARYNFNVRLSEGTGSVVDAIWRGIGLASYDKVIIMDGDLSHPPEEVHKLVSALDDCDMVIGGRYSKDGHSKDSLTNRIVSGGFNFLTLGLTFKVKDRASGFWGIRKDLITGKVGTYCKPMLYTLVRYHPETVVEIPYTFNPRTRGESKLGRGIKAIGVTSLDIIYLYLVKMRRPLKFALVGTGGTLVHLGILYSLTEWVGWWYMASAIVGAFGAFLWNFNWNKWWTFGEKK